MLNLTSFQCYAHSNLKPQQSANLCHNKCGTQCGDGRRGGAGQCRSKSNDQCKLRRVMLRLDDAYKVSLGLKGGEVNVDWVDAIMI